MGAGSALQDGALGLRRIEAAALAIQAVEDNIGLATPAAYGLRRPARWSAVAWRRNVDGSLDAMRNAVAHVAKLKEQVVELNPWVRDRMLTASSTPKPVRRVAWAAGRAEAERE